MTQRQTEPVSRNLVEKYVTGRGEYVRQAIDELVAGGFVRETHGGGRTRLIQSAKPFPGGDEPGTNRDDRSSIRPPLQGGRNGRDEPGNLLPRPVEEMPW